MTNWKEYWVYEELKDNYDILVYDHKVQIKFKDGGVYAQFDIHKYEGEYYIYDQGELLNGEMDFTSTFDEVVCSCLYYFYSRY